MPKHQFSLVSTHLTMTGPPYVLCFAQQLLHNLRNIWDYHRWLVEQNGGLSMKSSIEFGEGYKDGRRSFYLKLEGRFLLKQ